MGGAVSNKGKYIGSQIEVGNLSGFIEESMDMPPFLYGPAHLARLSNKSDVTRQCHSLAVIC